MPTYAYRCADCGHAFDIHQAFTDDSLTTCPECSGQLRKVYGSVGVTFKGSGFYRNDSRAGNGTKSSGGSSSSSGSGSGSSGSGSSGSTTSSGSGSSGGSSSSGGSGGSSSSGGSGASKAASS